MSGAKSTAPPPGMAAAWPSQCPRCDQSITRGDRIIFARGNAVHVECASGASDE